MTEPNGVVVNPITPKLTWKIPGLAWCFIVAGAFFRFYDLTKTGLWNDEGFSYLLGRLSALEIINATQDLILAPPLWYFLCKIPLLFSPATPWVVRLPAVFSGILTLYALFWGVRYLINERAALWALILLSVSPIHVFYSQEGRNYSLLSFLYFLAIIFSHLFVIRKEKVYLILSTLCCILLLSLHDISAVLWVCVNIYFFSCFLINKNTLKSANFRSWVVVQVVILSLYAIHLRSIFSHLGAMQKGSSYALFWPQNFWLKGVLFSLRNLVSGDLTPLSKMPIPAVPYGSYVFSVLSLAVVMWCFRRKPPMNFFLLLGAMLVPLFALSIFSDLVTPVYWIGRTEVIVAPLFCILLGFSLSEIRSKYLKVGLAGIFVFASLFSWTYYHFSQSSIQKKWDLISAKSVYYENRNDLIIVDHRIRASVLSHLLALAPKGVTNAVYPDENLDKDESIALEFLQSKLILKSSENITAAKKTSQKIVKDLSKRKQTHLTLVHAASYEDKELIRDKTISLLLKNLESVPCHLKRPPGVYPMDWHRGGYHVVMTLKCGG